MKKTFWSVEHDYFEARRELENACYNAETLKDALDTGVGLVYFKEDDGYLFVGYLDKEGEYQLDDDDIDLNTPVDFYSLDRDEEGYTMAIFYRKETE